MASSTQPTNQELETGYYVGRYFAETFSYAAGFAEGKLGPNGATKIFGALGTYLSIAVDVANVGISGGSDRKMVEVVTAGILSARIGWGIGAAAAAVTLGASAAPVATFAVTLGVSIVVGYVAGEVVSKVGEFIGGVLYDNYHPVEYGGLYSPPAGSVVSDGGGRAV